MSNTEIQFRRGNTAANEAFTGADGEVTIDQTTKEVVTHDGTKQGGHRQYNRDTTVPTVADAKALDVPIGFVIETEGYTESGDGGANRYVVVASGAGTDDGGSFIDMDNGLQLKGLFLNGVYPEQFGAKKDGTSDDTPAFVAAFNFCGKIITTGGLAQATATLSLSRGTYRIESGATGTVAVRRPNAVSLVGDGSGVSWIKHYGSGTAFKPEDTTDFMSSIRDSGYSLIDSGASGDCGWHVLMMIRGCSFYDVFIRDFFDNIRLEDVWTFTLDNVILTSARNSNVFDTGSTGELFINGGRYDVSESHNIYFNSPAGELIINTGAIQFSKKAGIKVDTARTVIIRDGFIEGNCIGSATDYHLDINGAGGSNTSCVIESSVINDRNDPDRTGLGCIFVDNFESFTYVERWTRNAVQIQPIVGANVQRVVVNTNSASGIDPIIQNKTGDTGGTIEISQLNRPKKFYGQDMLAGGSFNPEIKSTSVFYSGKSSGGVALGTYEGVPAVQSGSGSLQINPHQGDLELGSLNAMIGSGTNTYHGTVKMASVLTGSNGTPGDGDGYVGVDTTNGNRQIDLVGVVKSAGRMITVGKLSSDANRILIQDSGSALINGSATVESTDAYKHWNLITDGTDWYITGTNASAV